MKYNTINPVVEMYDEILTYLKKNKEEIVKQHSESTFNTIWMDTACARNNVSVYV